MSEPMILEALTSNDAGRRIAVPATGAVLGRDSDCDIALGEATLSRKHCRFTSENGEWVVQDLGSRSGVIVNGQKTSRSPLKQGDEIRLGLLRLKVVSLPTPQVAPLSPSVPDETKAIALSDIAPVASDSNAIPLPTTDSLIRFKCKCGKHYAIKDAFAGKMTTCKHCGASLTIPLHTVEGGEAVPEVQRKMKLVIVAGIAVMVLTLLAGGFYVYYALRQDARRSDLAKYNTYLTGARDSIGEKDIKAAIEKLQAAIALPNYVKNDEAVTLLKEAQSASSPEQVLQAMSDTDFQALCSTGTLPPSHRLSYGPLNAIYLQRLLAVKDVEAARRNAIRQEEARKERERLDAERRQREKREHDEQEARAVKERFLKSPLGMLLQKHPDWGMDTCKTIADHKISIGMTSEQVIEAWGQPQGVNTTITSHGVRHEQWVYGIGQYVYFKDGVLTSIQQSQ